MEKNKKKFSWSELFSNESGKTSATAFCGVVICLSGTATFVLGCVDKMWITHTIDVITQSIVFVGIGATLMGVRKIYDVKATVQDTSNNQPEDYQMINS
jgi:hypothetical protein